MDNFRSALQASIDADSEDLGLLLLKLAGMVTSVYKTPLPDLAVSQTDLQNDLWIHLFEKVMPRYRARQKSLPVDAYTYLWTASLSHLKDINRKASRRSRLFADYEDQVRSGHQPTTKRICG